MINEKVIGKRKRRAAAFCKERYRPGVISPARILWGSAGAGLVICLLAMLSSLSSMAVFLPPLAATCFITASCAYLRVARPKPVIVGHCVSAFAGLVAIWAGALLPVPGAFVTPLQLGLAVALASAAMQILDADHPPAAATAVFPILAPEAAAAGFLPLTMAWGATMAVCLSMLWNRMRFEFPAPEEDCEARYAGLFLPRAQFWGFGSCFVGALLLLFQSLSGGLYFAGALCMAAGVALLGTHHLWSGLFSRR